MADWVGWFDDNGSPRLTIAASVQGTQDVPCGALIDTGFTGFLSMPIKFLTGIPVIIEDIKTLRLADGSRIIRLQSRAKITVENESIEGIAYLEPEGQEVLLGTTFLELSKRVLVLFPPEQKVIMLEKVHP
ncbi:MAG TPA: hypothetical protein VFD13_09350 [Candidatus Kapabacteria bacterium]|nr:hypothetical protein [Candidatus Kapabacteria bacterium]